MEFSFFYEHSVGPKHVVKIKTCAIFTREKIVASEVT
jgi:hypothetical protein